MVAMWLVDSLDAAICVGFTSSRHVPELVEGFQGYHSCAAAAREGPLKRRGHAFQYLRKRSSQPCLVSCLRAANTTIT